MLVKHSVVNAVDLVIMNKIGATRSGWISDKLPVFKL